MQRLNPRRDCVRADMVPAIPCAATRSMPRRSRRLTGMATAGDSTKVPAMDYEFVATGGRVVTSIPCASLHEAPNLKHAKQR